MIGISYQPAGSLVAQGGYQAGLGNYNRFVAGLGMQQQQLNLSNTENLRGLANDQWQTQFGAANQQTMQARGIASDQYMQGQGLQNQDLMQQNDIANQQYQQVVGISGQLAVGAQQGNYGMAMQQAGGQIDSALSAQGAMQQAGLSSQSTDQSAYLQNQQAQLQLESNRANFQNKLDFLPQMSQAEYSAQQSQYATKMSSLQDALSNGDISQDDYNTYSQQLLGQSMGIRAQMPARSDVAQQYQTNTVTSGIVDPVTGQQIRGQYNSQTGQWQQDPMQAAQFDAIRYQNAQQVQSQSHAQANQVTVSSAIANAAIKMMDRDPNAGRDNAITFDQAYMRIEALMMANLKRQQGAPAAVAALGMGI